MTKLINEHQGSKYLRAIFPALEGDTLDEGFILIDIYSVLEAFKVTCPARQHALKKLLCAGLRDKGSELEDLIGIEAAVARTIELQKIRENNKDEK